MHYITEATTTVTSPESTTVTSAESTTATSLESTTATSEPTTTVTSGTAQKLRLVNINVLCVVFATQLAEFRNLCFSNYYLKNSWQ